MRIILARHGDTAATDGKLHGATNEVLSPKGRAETYKLAKELKQYDPIKIYSSPVKRARQTAEIISSELDIPMEIGNELQCWDLGSLVGKDINDGIKDIRYYLTHPDERPKGGESFNDFAERFLPYFEEGFTDDSDDTVIDLTHGRNILLAKAYIKKGAMAPKYDQSVMLNNKESTDHAGYAIAEPPNKFEIITPVAVAHGRS